MFARTLMFAVLALGTPAWSVAQAAHHSTHADTTDNLVGTWDGLFNSAAMGQGGMRLVISKRADWKATVTVTRDESMSAEAIDFKVQGKELSWTLDLHGTPCDSTAIVEGSVLKGETACGGQVAFTFELRKIS